MAFTLDLADKFFQVVELTTNFLGNRRTSKVEVSRANGLSVDELSVKEGFKKGLFGRSNVFVLQIDRLTPPSKYLAYKQWAASHPLYGKLGTPPLTPAEWWTSVILDTFIFANVPAAGRFPFPVLLSHCYLRDRLVDLDLVKSQLATTLVHRFWSREGYALHPDVLPTLSLLVGLSVTPAIATGSDPGTINVLRDLGILDVVSTAGAVMECDIYTTWDLEKEKKNPQFWHTVLERINRRTRRAGGDEIRAAEVLVVGDELTA